MAVHRGTRLQIILKREQGSEVGKLKLPMCWNGIFIKCIGSSWQQSAVGQVCSTAGYLHRAEKKKRVMSHGV
jgi:hypothetical protein